MRNVELSGKIGLGLQYHLQEEGGIRGVAPQGQEGHPLEEGTAAVGRVAALMLAAS